MRVPIISALLGPLGAALAAAADPPSLGEVEQVRRDPHPAVITAAPGAARLEKRQALGADWMGFAYYSGQCEFSLGSEACEK